MLGKIALKLTIKQGERMARMIGTDFGNPLNVDTVDFFTMIGKGGFHIIKEVLLP